MNLKKLITIIIIFLLAFFTFFANFYIVLGDEIEIENSEDNNIYYDTTVSQSSTSASSEPDTNSKHIVAIDRLTNTILYEKNAKEKTPMASTTKIMTCIVVLENCNLNDTAIVSKKASSIHGSTLGIKEGMAISIESLLYGLMLRSGNDCAIALAEHISGSVENFCQKMNEKAKSLGLSNTNFTSPHGLDDDAHYTTAYELALITNYALSNSTFRKIVSTKNITLSLGSSIISINNTNELLGNLEGVYGVKTGFTFNAGRCLVSSCKRKDLDIIVVVLGADTKSIRTKDSINIINYVFNNYKLINIKEKITASFKNYYDYYVKNVSIHKSTDIPILELEEKQNYIFPILIKNEADFNIKINCIHKLSYNTPANSQIGTLSVYNSDKLLYSTNIFLKNSLSKKSVSYYFEYILKNYFSLMYI